MKYLIFLLLSIPVFSQEEIHHELYTYQTTGKTVSGEAMYRVSVRKHLFLPALESALSETGEVKIISMKMQRLPFIGRQTFKNQGARSMAFRMNVGAKAYMFFNMDLLMEGTLYENVSCSLGITQNNHRRRHRSSTHQLEVTMCTHPDLHFDLKILASSYRSSHQPERPITIEAAKYLCQNRVRVAGEHCRQWQEEPDLHVKF